MSVQAIRTYREVGKIMGISWQGVQVIERRALTKLRLRLLSILKQENPELAKQFINSSKADRQRL